MRAGKDPKDQHKDQEGMDPSSKQARQEQQQQQGLSRSRARLLRPSPSPKPIQRLPQGRWKAATASLGALGMLLHGGAAPGKGGSEVHLQDAWLLDYSHLRWQQANYTLANSSSCGSSGGGGEEPVPSPAARHSHTMVAYEDASGRQAVLLFGGRRSDGLLLNDVWQGVVCWPAISWELLSDPQARAGSGGWHPAWLRRDVGVADL